MSIRNNNALSNQQGNEHIHDMSLPYRFFCWCSGANLNILRRFPVEFDRYFGIGTAVFMTGAFAFISSSYAISSIFKDKVTGEISYWSVMGFGVAWSLFIFFLDRYFVSSMAKAENKTEEFKLALPRFILAIFIGLVISHPLELRIFKEEIDEHMAVQQRDTIRSVENYHRIKIDGLKHQRDSLPKMALTSDEQELRAIDSTEAAYRQPIDDFYNTIVKPELDGTGGSGKANPGPIYQKLKEEYDGKMETFKTRQQKEWNVQRNLINNRRAENKQKDDSVRNVYRVKLDTDIKNEEDQIRNDTLTTKRFFATSILKQSEALSAICNNPTNTGANTLRLAIILLFILLEVSPILVKYLSKPGSYDNAIRTLEHGDYAQTLQDRHLIREELKLNRDLINRTSSAQRDLMREGIRQWRNRESTRLNGEDNDEGDA